MPTEVKPKFDVTESDIFFEEVKQIHQVVASRLNALEEQSYAWLDEILQIAKKAFKEDETCLLPKTPSAKRKARGRPKRTSKASPRRNILDSSQIEIEENKSKAIKKRDQSEVSMSEDENFDTPSNKVLLIEDSDDDFCQPAKPTRATRANSKAAAPSRAKNTRNASKKNKNKGDDLMKNSETDLSCVSTPENRGGIDPRTCKTRLSQETNPETPKNKKPDISSVSLTPKAEIGMEESMEVVEEWTQSASQNTIELKHRLSTNGKGSPKEAPKTPVQKVGRVHDEEKVQEDDEILTITPVQENKKKRKSSRSHKTPENNVTASDVNAVVQKTPDTIVTNKTCSAINSKEFSFYEETVYEQMPAIPGVGPNGFPSEKKATPRISMTKSRASLKILPSKQKEMEMHVPQQAEEQPVRTRTRLRLKKKDKELEGDVDNSSVSSDDRMEVESAVTSSSGTETEQDKQIEAHNQGEQQVTEVKTSTRTKTRQAKKRESSDSKEVEPTKVEQSAPRKLRSSQENEMNVNSNKDSGVGGSSGSSGDELPRATRSKMRKPPVAEEEPRSTRTKTRKRQLDEEEAVSAQPKRSRSCYQEIADENKATPTIKTGSSDEKSDSDDIASPSCPSNKVVRPHPHSFLNKFKPLSTKLNITPIRTAQINPGLVRSFIKSTATKEPTLKEIQEKKKKDLFEKEKKQEELQKKREEEHKRKMEEFRKRREDKMRKVQECRELKAKQEQENRMNMEKKMAEKRNYTMKLKEEKLKEEKEKQKLRLQKFEEAEVRRKHEEEETKKKLKEQLEHEKMQAELMQRKKELEEQERHKKMEEERQRAVERQLELEKERERDRERLAKIKAAEDEKHKEWLKKKEERERLIVKEKAEREKYELEKRKEHDLQLKREMERVREQDKLRLAEQERIREQQKKHDMELKKMVEKHNTQVQNHQNTLPKPDLNKTHSLNEPTVNTSKTRNDSYEMTPDRVHKPATAENYCIDDIKSDDETDDDEAPRKKVPDWAQGAQLKAILIKQHLHPPNLDLIFDAIDPPDLNQMFEKKRARFNKRTSSAHWDEPILKPGLLGRT